MNKCTRCGKPVAKFQKKSRRCQSCRTEIHKEYCRRVGYHKKLYSRIKDKERERHLVKKYGVNAARYSEMLANQRGACAICQKAPRRKLHVDHDHKTGAVRGLLCRGCNHMLGVAADDPKILLRAVRYIVPEVAQAFIEETMRCLP